MDGEQGKRSRARERRKSLLLAIEVAVISILTVAPMAIILWQCVSRLLAG